MLKTTITAFAVLFCPTSAIAQDMFYCPSAEDVWIVEKEFPEAPGWADEARVRNNWVQDTTMRRPVRTSGPGDRGSAAASPRGGNPPGIPRSRPRTAPMLTHDRTVGVEDGSVRADELPPLPPVMPAMEWLQVEQTEYGIRCRYSLQDGRDHSQPGVRPAEATIPINRQSCGMNSAGWSYSSRYDGEVCDGSRTACQFSCSDTPVLESW